MAKKKIYLVTSGEYDSYTVEFAVRTANAARRRADEFNKKLLEELSTVSKYELAQVEPIDFYDE